MNKRVFMKNDTEKYLNCVRLSMISRCQNKKNKAYENYGKRGIKVFKEWIDNHYAFFEWALNNGYKKGLTLDRKNNDGDYTPTNCRWVSRTVQQRNTRIIRKNNTSGYRGVSYRKDTGKYKVRITVNYKEIALGCYNTAKEGAIAYNNYIIKNKLEHSKNNITD